MSTNFLSASLLFFVTFPNNLKTESPATKFKFLKECLIHVPFPVQENDVLKDFSEIFYSPVQIGVPHALARATSKEGSQCKTVLIFIPFAKHLTELRPIIRNTATFTIFTWKDDETSTNTRSFEELLLKSGLYLEESTTFFAPICEILGQNCKKNSGQGNLERQLNRVGTAIWYFDTYFEGVSHFKFCNDNIRNLKDLKECSYQHTIHHILTVKLNMTFLHVRVKNGKAETETGNFRRHTPISLEIWREYANPDISIIFQPGDALILNDIWNSQLMYCTIDRIFEKPTWTYFTRPLDFTSWICIFLTPLVFGALYRNIWIGLNLGLTLISQPPQGHRHKTRRFLFPLTSILFLAISQYYQSILTTDITAPPKAKITSNYEELFAEHKYVFSSDEYGADKFINDFSKVILDRYHVQVSADNFKPTKHYVPTFQFLADCECIETFVEPTALKRTGRKLGLRNKNFSCYAMDGKSMEEFHDTLTMRAGINSVVGKNVYKSILNIGAGGIIQFWYKILVLTRPAYERRKTDSQDGEKTHNTENTNEDKEIERSLPLDSSIRLIFILHLLVLLASILILVVEVFWKNAEYVAAIRSKAKARVITETLELQNQ